MKSMKKNEIISTFVLLFLFTCFLVLNHRAYFGFADAVLHGPEAKTTDFERFMYTNYKHLTFLYGAVAGSIMWYASVLCRRFNRPLFYILALIELFLLVASTYGDLDFFDFITLKSPYAGGVTALVTLLLSEMLTTHFRNINSTIINKKY